jgi:hypothetical protein
MVCDARRCDALQEEAGLSFLLHILGERSCLLDWVEKELVNRCLRRFLHLREGVFRGAMGWVDINANTMGRNCWWEEVMNELWSCWKVLMQG